MKLNFRPKFSLDLIIGDLTEITLQRLRNNRYRTFLTILGVSIGIAVVYVLVSLTFGLQKLVIGNLTSSDSLLALDVLPNTEISDVVKLSGNVLDEIKGMEGVSEVSATKSLPAEIVYNEVKSQTLIYGVEPRYFSLSNIHTDSGELYTNGESKVVVSSAILSLFGISEKDALGTNVRLSFLQTDFGNNNTATSSGLLSDIKVVEIPEQFTIVGVINDDINYLYLPLHYFSLVSLDEYQNVKVKVVAEDKIEPVRDEILAKGLLVTAMTDTLTQINNIFRVTQVTFTVIGIIALVIAAIGMINTMTVSLLERTREIGIMKTIGATSPAIKQMFLAESMIIGLGGGIGGLLLGFILTLVLDFGIRLFALAFGGVPVDIFYTPLWFYLLVLVFSLFIGVFTGLFPARRASSINPLDALRYE